MSALKTSNLNERESTFLSAVVEEYIASGTPVSSGHLKKYCGLKVSPATIRNVMASLEQKGFLTHFHTSGGRVPTDIGYRFYVDAIPEFRSLDDPFSEGVEEELLTISNNVDELLNATAFMLAKVSRMFGVVLISGYRRSVLTDIELVALKGDRVMLVLAMDTGLVKSIVLNLDLDIKPVSIDKITWILKERLVGCTLKEIHKTIKVRLVDSEMYSHELVQVLVNDCLKYFRIDNNKLIYTSSYDVLLEQKEFQDLANFQRLLPALDKAYLNQHFKDHFSEYSDMTLIGKENNDELLNDCSILTTQFDSGLISGRIGVLGPKRIPYGSVQSILGKFAEIVQRAL
ncbi:MAG: heat-inducible transcriptional repressor HrcA [Candidatus Marinimicrobia bacterium]|nr:heat-inducible transcriptional repressor HrcA [Candidatus Neomarinimicrobiota bacterium]